MDVIDSLILGIVQGLAEYLPISSSGHLEIGQQILNMDLSGGDALQFDLTLHVATVLSTIVVLWKEFVPLCQSFFTLKRDDNSLYVWKLLVSAIPVMVVGLFLKDSIEGLFGQNLTVVGICLCVTAALLAFAYFFRTRKEFFQSNRNVALEKGRKITFFDAFIIGCAQAVAVLPGLSRSGTTIATGIIIGDNRERVARFSFFMVIIPILGSALLDIKDMLSEGVTESIGILPLIVGFIAAFVVGCIACKWMLNLVKKGKLIWFALYCVIVGILCLVW